ncbi:MAG TPA: polyprenyl synthetase family protein [Flavobacteriales bacterium]|jgi:geranylgeranyl diphosphate synthase type II|nr:polyprenyl synthetase family protein [Flavobacteriales bacterium]HIL66924.1 polyprenyl synthetase family protein [Flavobacteriales bacterium]
MQTISQLSEIIEGELGKINYPKTPEKLYRPIEYVMDLGGKRMRPILLLMAHQLFDKNIEKAISPALGIEVFHNFTLLHDDIMDNAPIRRGQQTVHEKWDNNVAILSGDTMLVQAYKLLTDVDKSILKEVLAVFNKAATEVCEGQQWDMDFETEKQVSIADYLKMIEYKTAVLLAASLQVGAICGKASEHEQKHLYEFGKNMGIAFQLKDDLLDTFGNPDEFGKQVGGDIMANKKTYLYLKALEVADKVQKEFLQTYFSSNENMDEKVSAVKSIFTDLEIPALTTALMKQYHQSAMQHLDAIDSENKAPLITFSEKLMDRIS